MNEAAAPLDVLQAGVALILLGAALVAAPRSLLMAARFWFAPRDADTWIAASAFAVAAVVRWLAPLLIATVFIGYHLTQQAIDLFPISHYGAGASAFYHALFEFLPIDHRTLMRANSLLGVLTLPMLAMAAARILDDRRAGALFAFLAALTPLFIRNDNSDANNVPCLFWLSAALVAWSEYLERRDLVSLSCAKALAALASISRPEMPALALALVGVQALCVPRSALLCPARPLWRDPRLYLAMLLFAILVTPHLLHVQGQIANLQGRASLPGLSRERLAELPYLLVSRNAWLDRRLFPWSLVALAAVGIAMPISGRRRAPLLLALLAVLATLVYVVDLDWANEARVHVPAALLVTMLAAGGLSSLIQRFPSLPVRIALIGVTMLPAFATARMLWTPTNDLTEERLVRAALDKLPAGPFTFVRLAFDDRDPSDDNASFTHVYFPDYLITAPVRQGDVLSVSDWIASADLSRPAFFFGGVRCYARFRTKSQPIPHGDNLQPGCARMRSLFSLAPVIEWDVPNYGDVWLEYYGDAKTLRVGLYRIEPLRP